MFFQAFGECRAKRFSDLCYLQTVRESGVNIVIRNKWMNLCLFAQATK